MTAVLVTGGTGVLGRRLVPALTAAGHDVRTVSRHPHGAFAPPEAENRFADVRTGEGIHGALHDIDTVIHAATSPWRRAKATEVGGTRQLLDAAATTGVRHLIYVSIVGVDRNRLPYYKAKFAAERVIETGSVAWTILRATQFHDLLDGMFAMPLLPTTPSMRFQPIDAGEVAARLVQLVDGEPIGHAEDIGGPEVLTMHDLAAARHAATGHRTRLLRLPSLGPVRDFDAGANLAPEHRYGTLTWATWLAQRPASA